MKTLDEYKKELLNILKKQAKPISNIEKSLIALCGDFLIEKGKVANIGEVRTWGNRKFRKIAQGKWRPIYESESRGAKQSIRIIAGKIKNAKSTDELLEIVMQNVNRFQDENGKILPIVEELKNAVNEKKQSLNARKPSTQEQIDKWNKEHNQKDVKDMTEDELLKEKFEIQKKCHNITSLIIKDERWKKITTELKDRNKKNEEEKFNRKKNYYPKLEFKSKGKNKFGYSTYEALDEVDNVKYYIEMGKWGAKWASFKNDKKIDGSEGHYYDSKRTLAQTKDELVELYLKNKPEVTDEMLKQEAPKTEEKAESSNSSESKDLSNNKFANLKEPIKPSFIKGKWNGKIYGDEKYGYRIYVDNNEFTLSKNEYEELHKYNIDHKEWETENLYKGLATSKISSKILKDLGTVIERFNSYSEENLNKLKELKNKFQNTDLITGIKDKFYTNLLDDVKDGRLRQKGLSQLPQPSKDDVKAIIEIFKNDKAFRDEIKNRCLEKITNEINKLEKQAKEIQEGKEYNERYNNDEEFRKKEREKNQKQADRIKEIAGEGYWNGKVYGSARNGYSIYVKNKKYTIPESDYELFDLKKSFSERISEILKSLK